MSKMHNVHVQGSTSFGDVPVNEIRITFTHLVEVATDPQVVVQVRYDPFRNLNPISSASDSGRETLFRYGESAAF